MKKSKIIIYAILLLIAFINIILVPNHIRGILDNSKSLFYKDNYRIKQYKLDSISFHSYTDQDGNRSWSKLYYKGQSIRINAKTGLLNFKEIKENRKYFEKTILNNYILNKRSIIDTDSIWVWSNPKAIDLYAKGKEKQLDTFFIKKKLIRDSILFIIAVLSIVWIIKNFKRKKTQRNKKPS